MHSQLLHNREHTDLTVYPISTSAPDRDHREHVKYADSSQPAT
jgi:hypothetical protein